MPNLSANQAAKMLSISKATMEKWILRGKIKAKQRPIGARIYYEIKEKEVIRLKGLITKKRRKGKALLPY